MHSKQDIENAARLVPEHVNTYVALGADVYYDVGTGTIWQPWDNTEAGSADWAVLDTAVRLWFDGRPVIAMPTELSRAWEEWSDADTSGDLNKRKAATFAAAAAIGAHMNQGESK